MDNAATFLAQEYGTGGMGAPNDFDVDYSSKGLIIQDSVFEGKIEIKLNWRQVAKRIQKLNKENHYLRKNRVDKYNLWLNKYNESKNSIDTSEHIGNYHISDMNQKGFAPRTRFRDNVNAIKTIKMLREKHRYANADEQNVLARYVGWGGLQDAFDSNNANWSNEYHELKELLDDDEYENARASVLTAFYTPPVIIKSIYNALGKFGFNGGTILEPSCGIGNFFGCMPEDMNCRLQGVEIDRISADIAKYLYPNAVILNSAYEKANLQEEYYDVAIGNVPFGQYKVYDSNEKDWNFSIHNYFFAKALKQIHSGGVIAFVTSSYMLDAKNNDFRKYIAQRAEFVGAIRLPDSTFSKNAGTSVVSDIIFLKKREIPVVDVSDDFLYTGKYKEHVLNEYYINNPDMVCGELIETSGRFGQTLTCKATDNFLERFEKAISLLPDNIYEDKVKEKVVEEATPERLHATPDIENFTYGIIDNNIYYRSNDCMEHIKIDSGKEAVLRGLIKLRQIQKNIISEQLRTSEDTEEYIKLRDELNIAYDKYVKEFGYIHKRTTLKLFERDRYVHLLSALEKSLDDGKSYVKEDIFYKRTIRANVDILHCDTVMDALAVVLNHDGRVNISHISSLCGLSDEVCIEELTAKGLIYRNPYSSGYETADEYLSGNIKDKLVIAKEAAKNDISYEYNVKALERCMPERVSAADINIRFGATWIPSKYYEEYMYHLFEVPDYLKNRIKLTYIPQSGDYIITNKKYDNTRTIVRDTYGTKECNAYEIFEKTINLKDIKITVEITDEYGRTVRELDRKATMVAQSRQDMIKNEFVDWLWSDTDRRVELEDLYNDKFNSTRNREFDGSHLTLPGSNPDITLNAHQLNAIARIIYGGNTLLAHVVGAGKTFEMVAAAMEGKRLGTIHKALFVVPNHLTLQTASEFLALYPGANLLVAKPSDFEKENRKEFCSRIAMGEYDGVIIGHSQFGLIPVSKERQQREIQRQVDEVVKEIEMLNGTIGNPRDNVSRETIKRLERTKKALMSKLTKMADIKQDDVITFEELGVDCMFVDEAHYYKNLYVHSKMGRNISGIPTSESQKSFDMYMKCRYLNEITNERGVIFATGTPVSNTMVEMYTMQRYLKPSTLEKNGLSLFDAWASTFGDTVTAMELAPEGTGYRMKTRFSKFYNLPELISMFKEFADIKTADMLNLDVPDVEYHNITVKPSEYQKNIVKSLGERAELVRSGSVNPKDDNMLKITTDGRKLALDQRILNPEIPEADTSKVKNLVENAISLYHQYNDDKALQLIFCDISTPTTGTDEADGRFINIYDDIRKKLIEKGVADDEIAYIHTANNDTKKDVMFRKCCKGEIRFLLGSTTKLGAGTNIQDRLIALHHLDVPWRPSDIEQQEGRIIRRGNRYNKVHIFRYVTEGTFDAYSWQIIENKQKFIGQIMTSKTPVRVAEDVDDTALSYAEIKALASGNPFIKERMELEAQVAKLKMLEANYRGVKLTLADKINISIPAEIQMRNSNVDKLKNDMKKVRKAFEVDGFPGIILGNKRYDDVSEAGEMLIATCRSNKVVSTEIKIGSYRDFELYSIFEPFMYEAKYEMPYRLILRGEDKHYIDLGRSPSGNFQRLDNALKKIEGKISENLLKVEELKVDLVAAQEEISKPFIYAEELKSKSERLNELTRMLDMDGTVDTMEEICDIDFKEDNDKVTMINKTKKI